MKKLMEQKHPVLRRFLEKEVQTKEMILNKLKSESGEHIEVRKKELQEDIKFAKEALHVYS